jgi:CheY-like chemotaxis protein
MKKVLIVDDDAKNIFALSAMLRSKGWETISATSMHEAMQLLTNKESVGIMLLDMMMPDMDGYEGLGLFRNDPLLKELPVIAVTAQAMNGDREKCLAAGADEYVCKPINIDRLLNLMHQFINTNRGDIVAG